MSFVVVVGYEACKRRPQEVRNLPNGEDGAEGEAARCSLTEKSKHGDQIHRIADKRGNVFDAEKAINLQKEMRASNVPH